MKYRLIGDILFVRVDRGEEILTELKNACLSAGVKLGAVSAIGASDDFTVGLYDVDTKKYAERRFTGPHEIVSLLGNVCEMSGEYYAHLHLSAANARHETFGGHLTRAVVSATCELTVRVADGRVGRLRDPESGLNLWDL